LPGTYIRTDETRKKMSESAKRRGAKWMIGRKFSEETKAKLSTSHKGKTWSEDTKRRWIESRTGKSTALKDKPWSENRRKAQLLVKRKPQKSHSRKKPIIKNGKEYPSNWHEIRKEIYGRDNWTCQECGIKCHGNNGKNKIQCHHIDYNTLNCSSDNLITLCSSCHAKTNFSKEDWQLYFQNRLAQKGD